MEPEWIRVSVSLRRFFSDERAQCLMAAQRSRSAGWLLRRVRRTFRLPGRLALLARARLLPPAEPLRLLREEDACDLEVIPVSFTVCDVSESTDADANVEADAAAAAAAANDDADNDDADADASPGPTGVLQQDEVDCGGGDVNVTLRCIPPAPRELEELKRRALRLLDETVPARRRRVRVRRRRPPAPSPSPSPSPTPAPDAGRGEGVRRARLVHAMSDECAEHRYGSLAPRPVDSATV